MGQWNEWIVQTNIADFKRKLDIESNPEKRRILRELLRNEEAKLFDYLRDEQVAQSESDTGK